MGKGKGKGRKKKSKEEIEAERKAREEEEERLRLEEEARLAEEKRIREEEERKRREAEAKRRKEELELLAEETKGDNDIRAQLASQLKKQEDAKGRIDDWNAFLACSHRPNPAKEADLNTYLAECAERKELDMMKALETCKYTLDIVSEVELEGAKALELGDDSKQALCRRFKSQLLGLLTAKEDTATAFFLQHAYEKTKSSSPNELKARFQVPGVKVGMWINLGTKNLRMKNIPFKSLDIVVDLNKPLSVQTAAFRVMHHSCNDAAVRAALIAAQEEEVVGSGAAAGASNTRGQRNSMSRSGRGAGAGAGAGVEEEDAAAAAAKAQKPVAKVSPISGAPIDQSLVPLGGVVYFEMLSMPARPKSVNKWTLHEMTSRSHTVERQQHPLRMQAGAAASAQAVKIKYKVPDHVIIRDDVPRVAFYDASIDAWNEDCMAEVHYDPKTRIVGFHTVQLTGCAVVQSRHVDFPYKSWSLAPLGNDTTVLRIVTPRFEVAIEITESAAKLLGPEIPELSHLLNKSMTPGHLLQSLARCGICLLPTNTDASRVQLPDGGPVTTKDRDFASLVYRDIGDLAAAFSVASSRYNQKVPSTKAVLRLKETLDPDEDEKDVHETDWRTVELVKDDEADSKIRSILLQALESHTDFGEEPCPLEVMHSTLRRTLASRSTPEGLGIADDSSPMFRRTVQQVLRMTRVLSLC